MKVRETVIHKAVHMVTQFFSIEVWASLMTQSNRALTYVLIDYVFMVQVNPILQLKL